MRLFFIGYSPTLRRVTRVPFSKVIKRLWSEFKYVYTNPYTLKWSIWYALFLCGFNQEGTYSQTLWQHIEEEHRNSNSLLPYTGFTESASTIFGSSFKFIISR